MNHTHIPVWMRALVLGMLCTLFGPREAQSQAAWRQTVQVIAPVETEEVPGILLDTLTTALERQNAPVRRSPDAAVTTFASVQRQLEQEGLGVASATHVFVTYRFHMTSAGTQYKILDLHFIFRSPGVGEEDIPILYVDLTDPETYHRLLVESGTTLPYNEAAFLQFRKQMSFHSLRDVVRVVQVGEHIIRDQKLAAAEKQRILTITTQFTYR